MEEITPEFRTVFSVEEEEYIVYFFIDDKQYTLDRTVRVEPGFDYVAIGYSDGTGTVQKQDDIEQKMKRLH